MNPLFNRLNQPKQQSQDPVNSMFGNFQNFQQQFNAFASQFSGPNKISPQQRVQQLLASGQMTQQQFEQLSQMANAIMGRKQ